MQAFADDTGLSWQEVGAFLGGLVVLLTTFSAFAFQYFRRDLSGLTKAQADIAGIMRDIAGMSNAVARLEGSVEALRHDTDTADNHLDAKMEKLTALLIQLLSSSGGRSLR